MTSNKGFKLAGSRATAVPANATTAPGEARTVADQRKAARLGRAKVGPGRTAVVSAVIAAAVLLAGCGSSKQSTNIAPGVENPHASAELAKVEKQESKTATSTTTSSSTTSAAVTTPTSGPLSKEPKVTPPSGPPPKKLEVKDLIKGKGPVAKDGDSVTVNYVGVLYKTGKVFDASWKRNETFPFTLGQGQVIEGWDKGVAGMHVGGRRELIIPASEAYGEKGSPPNIPPNEALVFVVDLLAV